MAVFVKYYYQFKKRNRAHVIASITEDYTEKSKGTRSSKAFKIFDNELQLDVLQMISESTRVERWVSSKAREILIIKKQ